MKIIYRLSVAALAVCLAACSSDSSTSSVPETPEAATPPVAAQVAPAAAPDAAPATASEVPTVRTPELLAPSAGAAPDELAAATPQRPQRRTTARRRAAEGQAAAPRRPTTYRAPEPLTDDVAARASDTGAPALAAAPAATPAPGAVVPAAATAPPDISATFPDDASAFLAQAAGAVQVFWARPGRDTVLVGQQGTLVAVPAGAWDVPAGSAPVRVELREFYTTPDIVLAGLSTRSGQQLLETGGMLKLDASVNGQPVSLRPGQRLGLRMPTRRKLDAMQLFQGRATDPHAIDWQLPASTAEQAASQADALAAQIKLFDLEKNGQWPQVPGGTKHLLKFFDKKIPADAATQARLRRRQPATVEEKQLLKQASKALRKRVLCLVRVALRVDSTGAARATLLPYGDEAVRTAVLSTTQQLTQWKPARFQRITKPHRLEKINAVGVLTVAYTAGGKRLIGVDWDAGATHFPRLARYFAAQEAKARLQGQQAFAARFASAGPLRLDDNLYYELEADGLGWINCDRFLEEGPRVQLAVQTPQPNTVVTLVFREQRSILASTRAEASATVFEGVPAGAAATVVALRRENGVTFLATAPVTAGQADSPALDFRPVSLEELRTALAQL